MKSSTLARNLLACALAAVAGYVDGIGYLHLAGAFVSFMSGNSTRLGVELASFEWTLALESVAIIGYFVLGAALGEVIIGSGALWRRRVLLCVEAVLLALAPLGERYGIGTAGVAAMVVAMGMENGIFQQDSGPSIGLTYMTGALVKLGQKIVGALRGGPRWAWISELALWVSLTLGALAGAIGYARFSLSALWAASVVLVLLAASLSLIWKKVTVAPSQVSDPGRSAT